MKISTTQKLEILAGLDFGATDQQIAAAMEGVSVAVVQRIRAAEAIPPVQLPSQYAVLEGEILTVFKTVSDLGVVAELFDKEVSLPDILKAAKIAGVRTDNNVSKREAAEIDQLLTAGTPVRDISRRFNNLPIEAISVIQDKTHMRRLNIQRRWNVRNRNRRNTKILTALKSGCGMDEILAQFQDAKQSTSIVSENVIRLIARNNHLPVPKKASQVESQLERATLSKKAHDAVIAALREMQREIQDGLEEGQAQRSITEIYQAVAQRAGVSITTARESAVRNSISFVAKEPEATAYDSYPHVFAELKEFCVGLNLSVGNLIKAATHEVACLQPKDDQYYEAGAKSFSMETEKFRRMLNEIEKGQDTPEKIAERHKISDRMVRLIVARTHMWLPTPNYHRSISLDQRTALVAGLYEMSERHKLNMPTLRLILTGGMRSEAKAKTAPVRPPEPPGSFLEGTPEL